MTNPTDALRDDVTPEAVATLRDAADNMPLNRPGQPWHGAADWLQRRADAFESALLRFGGRWRSEPSRTALRDSLAEAIYAGGDQPQWLSTVDGTANTASYEYAARVMDALEGVGATAQRIEYGLMWDCATNGCATPCVDDDHDDGVLPRGSTQPVTERVNGHAVTVVQSTVTRSPWVVSPPSG